MAKQYERENMGEKKKKPSTEATMDDAVKDTDAADKPKEHKERTFVDAKTGKKIDHPVQGGSGARSAEVREEMHAERKKNSLPFRIGAIALWVLGIACEVVAILVMNGTLFLPQFSQMVWLIIFLVLDLILVVIGSQLWKHANHLNPASKENKVAYWIQTDLGILIAVIAFAPIIVLMLTNKNLDKKTRQVCSIVAIIALVIAVASGVDYNPATQEELDEAQAGAAVLSDDGIAYWTPFGKVYHFNPDCQYIRNSATIYSGTLQDAIDAHRDRGCSGCTVADGTDLLENADPSAVADAAATAISVSDDSSSEESSTNNDSDEPQGEEEDEDLPQAA